MKRLFIGVLLVLSQGIVSCSTEDTPPEEEPNEKNEGTEDENEEEDPLHLSFRLSGDFKNLQDNESSQDLLGIQINETNGTAYAYVLADDLSALSLEVEREKRYQIITTYVKNGKEVIRSDQGRWLQPFRLSDGSFPALNEFAYSSGVRFTGLESAEMEAAAEEGHVYLPIDRYHVRQEVELSSDSEAIEIDLQRMGFGIDLHLDFGEASLIEEVLFGIGPPGAARRTYLLGLENGKAHLQLPLLSLAGPDGTLTAALAEGYSEEILFSLGTEAEPERFVNKTIMVSPNTELELDFSSKEGHPNLGFELEEGELKPEAGSLYEY